MRNIPQLGVLRRCVVCHTTKPVTEFPRASKKSPDGRHSQCLVCKRAGLSGYWPGYYERTKERSRGYVAQWHRTNREHVRESRRKRYTAAPWVRKAELQTRRALKKMNGSGCGVSAQEWKAILDANDNRCAHCLAQVNPLTMDHVIPLSKGGEHSPENVVPACMSCNSSKHDFGPVDILLRPHLLVTRRMLASS